MNVTDDTAPEGFIATQVKKRITVERNGVTPPLPDKLSIEVNNSCNHKCHFCQNPIMERPRRVMDDAMVMRVLQEAYDAGIRTVSFYSGGEPFLNRKLPDYVAAAKRLGFTYVYLSTNGGKVTSGRIKPVLEAGLDSLKFSINAGTREIYRQVHGLDEFDDVIANVEMVARHRAATGSPKKLFVSFVETDLSKPTFETLKQRIGHLVDEVVAYPFVVIGTPLKDQKDPARPRIGYDETRRSEEWNQLRLKLPCYQLWGYLNVTVEGYLSACCSDYNNDLIVGNLHGQSLSDAWHSQEFQKLRQDHIDRKVKGTLCHGCIAQKNLPYQPINPHLKTNET